MTHDEMIQVIRDHQAGHAIQKRFVGAEWKSWDDDPKPVWNFAACEYRRKLEPRCVKFVEVVEDE